MTGTTGIIIRDAALAPASVLSTADAKVHLKVIGSSDDASVAAAVAGACAYVEKFTRRWLLSGTGKCYYDGWGDGTLVVPMGGLTAISAVRYLDEAGTTQTLAAGNYAYSFMREPAIVKVLDGPALKADDFDTVWVEFTAGYADAASIPADLLTALKLLVTSAYEIRQTEIVGTIVSEFKRFSLDHHLVPFRVRMNM